MRFIETALWILLAFFTGTISSILIHGIPILTTSKYITDLTFYGGNILLNVFILLSISIALYSLNKRKNKENLE